MAGTERTEKKREKSKVKKVTQKDESSFSFYLHAALFLFFLTTYAFLLFLSKHKYPLILNNEILPEVLFFCLALLILSFVGLFLVSFWPLLMTLVISFITGMTVSYVLGLFLPYNSGHFLLHYLPFLPHDIQLYLASNGDMFAGIITGLLLFGLLRLSKGSILVLFSIPLLSALFMLLNTESKRTIPEKIQSVDALTPRENEKNENLIYLILADHSGYAVSAESWQRLNSKNPNANELPFSPTFIPSFYQENNFNLYPNIYLRYQFRHRNIGNILNPFLTGVKDDLFDRRGTSHYLSSNDPAVSATRNDLFKELKSKGYHINVYQSFPFNFCQNREMNEIANCTTYPAPIGALYQTNLSTASRMMLIAGHWLSSTPLGKKATEYFYKKANEKTDASKLPLLGNPFSRSMPIGQSSVLANLRQDVLNAKGKNLFFAHVNLPHYPYVYDKNCQLRTDPMEWRTNAPYTDKKEPNGEQKRWENYNQQLFCTYAQINHLIKELEKAQLMDKTTIIIHGDKGADIRREKADEVGIARQDKSVDLFKNSMTTVFAIRTPQEKAKINNESCDIVTLVERFVLNNNTAVCQPLASPSLTKEEQDKATEWLKLPIADNYLKTGPYTPLYTEWLENGGQAYMAYLEEQLKQENGKKASSKINFVAPPVFTDDNSAEEGGLSLKGKSAGFFPVPEKEDVTLPFDEKTEAQEGLKRVQVRTTSHKRHGSYVVNLSVTGGSATRRNQTRKVGTDMKYDLLYVLCEDGTRYLIPKCVLGRREKTLGEDFKLD